MKVLLSVSPGQTLQHRPGSRTGSDVRVIKHFYGCNLLVLKNRPELFAPARPFRPCLMFVGKAKTIPRSGTPGRWFPEVGSWPYPQILTWLGRLAREN